MVQVGAHTEALPPLRTHCASLAKYEELVRLMGILELDFEEKNVLPPREACLHVITIETF